MLEALSDAIAKTSANAYIADNLWVTPTVQTVHLLAIAALSGSVFMICGRLTGTVGRDLPIANVDQRYSPWVWWPALILLISGMVLVIGEPARELLNLLFRVKMALVLGLLGLVMLFQRGARREPASWQGGSGVALGVGIIFLWVAIVSAGRWIAYV